MKAGVGLMKLYIKEKRFSWRDQLIIRNEKDEKVYTVKSERISIGNKVHVYNQANEIVVSIEEKKMGFSPKYVIYQQNEKIAEVKREKNIFGPDYDIEKINWRIKGNVEKEDYEIKEGYTEVASFKKKLFSYGDTFVLETKNEKDAPLALGIVIAIWCLELDEQDKT